MALDFGAGGGQNPFFSAMSQVRMKSPEQRAAEEQKQRVENTQQYANDLGMDFIQEQKNYHGGLVERQTLDANGNQVSYMWFNDHDKSRGTMTEEWENYRKLMGKDANLLEFTQSWKQQELQTDQAKIGAINAFIAKNQQLGVSDSDIREKLNSTEMNAFRETLQRTNPELAAHLQWQPPVAPWYQKAFMNRDIDTGAMTSKLGTGSAAAIGVPAAFGAKYAYDKLLSEPKEKFIKEYVEKSQAANKTEYQKLIKKSKVGAKEWTAAMKDKLSANTKSPYTTGKEYNTALEKVKAEKEALQLKVKEHQTAYDNRAITKGDKKNLGKQPAINPERRKRIVELQQSSTNQLGEAESKLKQLKSKKGRKPKGYNANVSKLEKIIQTKKDAIAKANALLSQMEQPSRKLLDESRTLLEAKKKEIEAIKKNRFLDLDTKDITKAERKLLQQTMPVGSKGSATKTKAELEKLAKKKYGSTGSGPGIVGYMAPMAGEFIGEKIAGEEGAFIGKAAGVSFLTYAARHAPKRLAKVAASAVARHSTAGPTPWTQGLAALVDIGFTVYELKTLYDDWKNLQNK
jgi:hypothetical protein